MEGTECKGSKEEVRSGRPQRIFFTQSPLAPSTKTHTKTLLPIDLPSPLVKQGSLFPLVRSASAVSLQKKTQVSFHATTCIDSGRRRGEASIFDHFVVLQLRAGVSYLASLRSRFPSHLFAMSRRPSSMDAIFLDEWELLPDHRSSLFMEECGNGHGGVGSKDQLLLGSKLVMVDMDHFSAASHRALYGCVFDEEVKKPLLLPSQDVHGNVLVTEFKDIGVVQTELRNEKTMSKVTDILISGAKEEAEVFRFPDGVKEADQGEVLTKEAAPDHQFPGEDEGVKKIGFSVGNLRVHGVGALCSFGVAAATFFIFLLGGGKQQHTSQNHKIQLQMYSSDDQRIQRVMQQASRLNQTMSSVMGEASSARASISFGGHYHGF